MSNNVRSNVNTSVVGRNAGSHRNVLVVGAPDEEQAALQTGLTQLGCEVTVVRTAEEIKKHLQSVPLVQFVAVNTDCQNQEEISRLLFAGIGKVLVLPTHLMGIGGTISGCGPAFTDMIIEAFGDAGVKYGLPREAAYALVSQMLLGAAKLQRDTGRHPAALKDAVCSPGGSTIRGVTALEAHGLRAACQAAVDAVMAYKA